MIHIDGSQGEGGGQILRSSLALSIATGRPFRMSAVRANRPKPGLMRQHLTCVQAAQAISAAVVSGAAIGSREISFAPGPVRAGQYRFAIGTAGGTALVLQAVLPALLRAEGSSTVVVEGGTHNEHAPPFEFIERSLVPLLNRAGADVRVRLERHGFYPAGGGRVVVDIGSTVTAQPLILLERGEPTGRCAGAIVARVPTGVADRELAVLCARLAISPDRAHVVGVHEAAGPGNAAWVELSYEHVTEVVSGIGSVGRPAEAVAAAIADDALEFAAASHPVGAHLADQLMVPLALLGGGRYRTGSLSTHARTNMAVIGQFGVAIDASPEGVVNVPRLDP